jgi:hypothetical protein
MRCGLRFNQISYIKGLFEGNIFIYQRVFRNLKSLANTFNSLKFYILSGYLNPFLYEARIQLSMSSHLIFMSITLHSFPDRKSIHPVICGQHSKSKTEIKSKTVLRFQSIHQPHLPSLKIHAELPSKSLLPQFHPVI